MARVISPIPQYFSIDGSLAGLVDQRQIVKPMAPVAGDANAAAADHG